MGSDLALIIFDPSTGAVVANRWLGMSATIAKLNEIVQRGPDYAEVGYECWGGISSQQAALIAEASYMHGAKPATIVELARSFPDEKYWWIFTHGY